MPQEPEDNVKVSPDVLNWLKDEAYRQREATGIEPTYNDILIALIKITSKAPQADASPASTKEDRQAAGVRTSETQGQLEIPKSLLPVIEFLIEAFSEKGSPEEEMWKDSLRMLAAQRSADLKRRSKPPKASKRSAS
jgi:hypothetical protein